MLDEFDLNPFGLITTCLFMGGLYIWGKRNGQTEVVQSYEKMENDRRMAEMQSQIFYLKQELDLQKGLYK